MKTILQQKLRIYQQTDAKLYQQICAALTILYKQTQLKVSRQLYIIEKADHEDIAMYRTLDRVCKAHIYRQTISDPLYILEQLSEKTLKQMSQYDGPTLLVKLEKLRETTYQANQLWESRLVEKLKQQSWKDYLSSKIKYATQTVYQYSLVGFGGEVMGWLGRLIGAENSLRPLGEALGAELSIMAGWLAFSKHLMIILTGQAVHDYCAAEIYDDQHACITPSHHYLPSALGVTRLLSLLSAGLSSLYQARWAPLIQGVASLLGSLTAVATAQAVIPPLRQKSPSENQLYAAALIGLAGMEAGHILAQSGMQLFAKYMTCQAFAEEFSAAQFPGIIRQQARCPDLRGAFDLWFNDESPVSLEWLDTKQTFFQAECHLVTTKPMLVTVHCDSPEQYTLGIALDKG